MITPRVLADFNAPLAAVVLKASNAAELVEANSTSVSVISPAHEYKILIWTFESFILFKLVTMASADPWVSVLTMIFILDLFSESETA